MRRRPAANRGGAQLVRTAAPPHIPPVSGVASTSTRAGPGLAGTTGSRGRSVAAAALGGLLGGAVGALAVVGVVQALKAMLGVVAAQPVPVLLLAPLVGLALTTAVTS